jgi:hypothetical protein
MVFGSLYAEGGMAEERSCHAAIGVPGVPNVDGCGVIPCLWQNSFQKHLVLGRVKAKIKELNIDHFGFYAESWITDRSGLATDEPTPQKRLIDREECIFIYAEQKDGLSKSGYWPITESGGKAPLGDFVRYNGSPTSMRTTFANMFGVELFQ